MAEIRRTLCNRDCPDACSIEASIEGGRVVELRGDRGHPITAGFLCHRTNQFLRSQYASDRLVTPLLRRDGRLVPVSWDEALEFLATRLATILAESGPSAVLHYRSGGTLGLLTGQASDRFFELLGPTATKRGDICSGAGEAAQEADFGVCDSSDLAELERARHVLLWGKNVVTSSPHTIPFLKRAKENGAKLVMIDPVHNRSAELCDAFVQPRPGGDLALAMAALHAVFERGDVAHDATTYCDGLDDLRDLVRSRSLEAWCTEADVQPSEAAELARCVAEGPTTILVGWGMARRRNGGAIVRAIDALAAVTGNVGLPGTGVSYYFRRRRAFGSLLEGHPAPRTVCEPLLGEEILAASDPPIRAVWITAGNPVAMLPDSARVAEALATRELVVVTDRWLSDTAELATVVLPVNTLLEADDLVGAYGHHYLGVATPVVAPPPGVKSDLAIFQGLAAKLGLEAFPQESARDLKRRLVSEHLEHAGVDLERLEAGVVRNPLAPQVLFEGRRFPTASGKVQLLRGPLPDAPRVDLDYPMLLTSVSTPRSQSSQWAKAPPNPIEVTVHPASADGLAHGDVAWLESRQGRLRVRVVHDARQRRDVALIPKGGHYRDGSAANAITRARLTDLGEGGALYDEPVRLVPVAARAPTTE
ncbi:MAG: molybdopterin-dependent oxidoreductase [Deltaproteobacteria bacterium]|nr:molybdopterin-dependent oxidoreductase [Deltaproteobacteria bacterium]